MTFAALKEDIRQFHRTAPTVTPFMVRPIENDQDHWDDWWRTLLLDRQPGIDVAINLPAPLHDTIRAVGWVLQDAHSPWWIISGAAAALYGARPIQVSDVDVMISVEDARRLFPRIGLEQAVPAPHPRFRSEIFGRWQSCPLVVEFMANFELRYLDGMWRPMIPQTRRMIMLDDTMIFLPELAELKDMFTRFGRPKDQERNALLSQCG